MKRITELLNELEALDKAYFGVYITQFADGSGVLKNSSNKTLTRWNSGVSPEYTIEGFIATVKNSEIVLNGVSCKVSGGGVWIGGYNFSLESFETLKNHVENFKPKNLVGKTLPIYDIPIGCYVQYANDPTIFLRTSTGIRVVKNATRILTMGLVIRDSLVRNYKQFLVVEKPND